MTAKTGAERSKAYRDRQRQKNVTLRYGQLPTTIMQEDTKKIRKNDPFVNFIYDHESIYLRFFDDELSLRAEMISPLLGQNIDSWMRVEPKDLKYFASFFVVKDSALLIKLPTEFINSLQKFEQKKTEEHLSKLSELQDISQTLQQSEKLQIEQKREG